MLTTANHIAHWNSLWTHMPCSRAQLRVGTTTVENAMAGRFGQGWRTTAEGRVAEQTCVASCLLTDLPTIAEDDRVEIMLPGETTWRTCRVVGVSRQGGAVASITLGGLYEQ